MLGYVCGMQNQKIWKISSRELRIMRNYIFARHGYIFKSDDLRQYFSQYDWYTPISRNVTKELSKIERDNIKLIEAYED